MNPANSDIDLNLFSRISKGDEYAFEILFKKYVSEMEPVIFRLVKSREVVQDIVQDIFLGLWIGREKLDTIEHPSSWLYRLLYNRAYSWLEHQSVREKVHQSDYGQSGESSSNGTEETVGFREVNTLIRQAVSQLPEQTKKIYLLSREAGLKHREIADTLGLSVQTVKNTLTTAGKSIRSHLSSRGIDLPMLLLVYCAGQV